MRSSARRKASEKQRSYRERLRGRGLRPVQIWVPDTRVPGFAAECRRQARHISRTADEGAILDFITAVADWGDA